MMRLHGLISAGAADLQDIGLASRGEGEGAGGSLGEPLYAQRQTQVWHAQ
jgi:hypothetical protein